MTALLELTLLLVAVAQAVAQPSGGRVGRRATLEPYADSAFPLAGRNSSRVSQPASANTTDDDGGRGYSHPADEEADANDVRDVDDAQEYDGEDDDDRHDDDDDNGDDDDDRHDHDHDDKHHKKRKKHKKKKKKKHHHGFFSLVKKMKKHLPSILRKMHGPSMFMMGMAQANFHNFVMHALMMSKMALASVVFMFVREMVFGDKDQPVKYYNFGYDHHRRADYPSPYDYPRDYKRRRKRRLPDDATL